MDFVLVHISSLETTEESIQDGFLILKTIGKWCEQSNDFIESQDLPSKNFGNFTFLERLRTMKKF